ncbi:unnamed protein product [Schistosoma margrebowiei]|uniref:Uncharacterized protein n=1 Tax=Schistosoma margrebowiei TaxID=48269 RepID=A0A183MVL6_9TREM|nr:unnamed protein product [Schistosoma margrebowiei]
MSLSYVATLYAKYICRHEHDLPVSHTHDDMCKEAIEYNFGQIISGMKEVDPKEMCSLFGMCTCEYINSPGDTMLPSLSTSQDIPGVCNLCTLLVKKIFELTIGNQTEAAIVLAMETICEYLPSDYDTQCENFVEKYGAKIVSAIIDGTAPELICGSIGLCASPLHQKHLQYLIFSISINTVITPTTLGFAFRISSRCAYGMWQCEPTYTCAGA